MGAESAVSSSSYRVHFTRMHDPGDRWSSYHLYYHEDLDLAATEFVLPTVASALSSGWIDGFFFIRYQLGGPHLRLRLRRLPEPGDSVDRLVRREAERFLQSTPSRRSKDEEVIRNANRSILAADPNETDDTVYPDNTLLSSRFRPELQRYGGPALLQPSLDFFTISSIEALCFLRENPNLQSSRRLTAAIRLLARQALGFASDTDELMSLSDYATQSWGDDFPAILERARQTFLRQHELFSGIVRQELENGLLSAAGDTPLLGQAAHGLSSSLADCGKSMRWRIGGSHLHMLANRLGLSNPEELYLGSLLSSTLQSLRDSAPETWSSLGEALARRSAAPGGSRRIFAELLPLALAQVGKAPSA